MILNDGSNKPYNNISNRFLGGWQLGRVQTLQVVTDMIRPYNISSKSPVCSIIQSHITEGKENVTVVFLFLGLKETRTSLLTAKQVGSCGFLFVRKKKTELHLIKSLLPIDK